MTELVRNVASFEYFYLTKPLTEEFTYMSVMVCILRAVIYQTFAINTIKIPQCTTKKFTINLI